MRNATREAAARGWDIYKSTNPRPSLVAINEVLLSEGLGQVADRMNRHYQSMDRTGYNGPYISINRWDVSRTA